MASSWCRWWTFYAENLRLDDSGEASTNTTDFLLGDSGDAAFNAKDLLRYDSGGAYFISTSLALGDSYDITGTEVLCPNDSGDAFFDIEDVFGDSSFNVELFF